MIFSPSVEEFGILLNSYSSQVPQIISVTKNHQNIDDKTDRNIRLFISSTFRDMNEEREILMKTIMPEVREFAAERGVTISEVDLRWGITEEQSAQGDTINICLSEIDRCQPYFLCMLGERYGWSQPEDHSDKLLYKTFDEALFSFPWIDQYRDRSITELEIRHAALNHQELYYLPEVHFYFRNESFSNSKENYFKSENEPSKLRLDSLKEEIKNSRFLVDNYNHPNHLGQLVKQHLISMIDEKFPLSTKPTPLQKDRLVHQAFAELRSRVYVGGEKYQRIINEHLRDGFDYIYSISNLKIDPIIITGESGSGKSALISNWITEIQQKCTPQCVISHFIGCTSDSTNLGSMIRRIILEIVDYYSLPDPTLPTNLSALIGELANWLSVAGSRGGLILVLDAIDQLDNTDDHNLSWLPPLPPNVALITSTIDSNLANIIDSRFQKGIKEKWKVICVNPLTDNDIREFVYLYMKQFCKSLTSTQLTKILSYPQAKTPLFLKTLLDELRIFGSFEQLNNRIEYYLSSPNIPALINLVFERIEHDLSGLIVAGAQQSENIVGICLSLIYCSRRGLLESEISEMLSLSPLDWTRVYLALKEFLVNKSGVLTFGHEFVRKTIAARYLPNIRLQRDIRSRYLIRYFNQKSKVDSRVCEELPYQVLQTEGNNLTIISDVKYFVPLYSPEFKFDLYYYWACTNQPNKLEIFRRQFEYSLQLNEKIDYISCYTKVGKFLEDIAAYDLAIEYYSKALQQSPPQIKQADQFGNIAYVYCLQGKFTDSILYYEKAIRIFNSMNARESGDKDLIQQLAQAVNGMAMSYRKGGDLKKAEPLYKEALAIRLTIFGDDSEDVAQSYNSLGCLYHNLNSFKLSEENFNRAMNIRERIHGLRHPLVALTLNNKASLLMDCGRFSEAKPLLIRSLKINEEIHGENHPDYAQCLNILAGLYLEEGNYEESLKLFHKALSIKKNIHGENHPEYAISLNDIAVCYSQRGEYSTSLEYYKQALEIRSKVYNGDHKEVAKSLSNLAAAYNQSSYFTDAESYYNQAIQMYTRIFNGKNHPDVAQTIISLAGLYQKQGVRSLHEIEQLYQEALNIFESSYNTRVHPDISVLLNDMGVLKFKNNFFDAAEGHFMEAYKILKQLFSDDHPEVKKQIRTIIDFYERTQNPTCAGHFRSLL